MIGNLRSDCFRKDKKPGAATPEMSKSKVGIIGGGNFGSAIGNVLGRYLQEGSELFESEIKIWILEEQLEGGKSLCDEINRQNENIKYLPGLKLPENVKFVCKDEDYVELLKESDVLIYVLPTFVAKKFADDLKTHNIRNKEIITLMKGFIGMENGTLVLFSEYVDGLKLGHKIGALMGANIAGEIHLDLSEMTLGIQGTQEEDKPEGEKKGDDSAKKIKTDVSQFEFKTAKLFQTQTTTVQVIDDRIGVELCGALKNIVAIAYGIGIGLELSVNTQAAILRRGMLEMMLFMDVFRQQKGKLRSKQNVMFESCGFPDLFVTCVHGRNAKGGVRIGKGETVKKIEESMNGQKLHGISTVKSVYEYLQHHGEEKMEQFKLFNLVYEIANETADPKQIVNILKIEK